MHTTLEGVCDWGWVHSNEQIVQKMISNRGEMNGIVAMTF